MPPTSPRPAQAPDRPDLRNLLCLLLDASESMGWEVDGRKPIDELQEALDVFLTTDLPDDPILQVNAEVAVGQFRATTRDQSRHVEWLTLGDDRASDPFYFIDGLRPPARLRSEGQTPIGTAIMAGLRAIENRKVQLGTTGLSHEYRPLLYLITDGRPEGESEERLEEAIEDLQDAERGKHVLCFALGTGKADMATLERLSIAGADAAVDLRSMPIAKTLKFASASAGAVHALAERGDDRTETDPDLAHIDDPDDARVIIRAAREEMRKRDETVQAIYDGLADKPFNRGG
jgi:uncharacterized protein YegL